MLLSRTVRLFLDGIGRREEYEYYLNRFQHHDAPFFALICPDREALELSGDLLAFNLEFLVRLGLKAAVVVTRENADALHACFDAYRDTFTPGEAPVDARVVLLERPAASLADALRELVPGAARRVHLIRCAGSLHDTQNRPIALHYTQRPNAHALREDDAPLAALCADLLAAPGNVHLSICSPLSVLEELFTVRGHGTLVRRGSAIHAMHDAAELDRPRLRALFAEGFGKPLREDCAFPDGTRYFVESDYRGVAMLEPHPAGAFLSKFVVSRQARGEGLAQELWQEACAPEPALFWRSRPNNPINTWYARGAEGMQRGPVWIVYWRGIAPTAIPDVLSYCTARPSDFVESTLAS